MAFDFIQYLRVKRFDDKFRIFTFARSPSDFYNFVRHGVRSFAAKIVSVLEIRVNYIQILIKFRTLRVASK